MHSIRGIAIFVVIWLLLHLGSVVELCCLASATAKTGGDDGIGGSSSGVSVFEHPVFFDMPGLLTNSSAETEILDGLFDLQFSAYSNLYFLFIGKLLQSHGVSFTHALVSRFPSLDALRVYYDLAIKDIASKMQPWLKREYCVDYQFSVVDDSILLPNSTESPAFHVTFVKLASNVSDAAIDAALDDFLALADELDYVTQLTAGENLYLRESYRTMSHAFSAYLPSRDALEKLQQDSAFLSVLHEQILPLADSYAVVAFTPYDSSTGSSSAMR